MTNAGRVLRTMVRRGIVGKGTIRAVIIIDSEEDLVDIETKQEAAAMVQRAGAAADVIADVANVRGMENTVKTTTGSKSKGASKPASRHPLKG